MTYKTQLSHPNGFIGVFEEDGITLTPIGEEAVEVGLRIIAEAAHRNARSKGWYESDRGFPEEVALYHSESSEALEEYRDGRRFDEHYYKIEGLEPYHLDSEQIDSDDFAPERVKPEGIAAELGDVVIRIGDSAGNPDRPIDLARGVIEKLRYNRTRPTRHGKIA